MSSSLSIIQQIASLPNTVVVTTGCTTVILASLLTYVLYNSSKNKKAKKELERRQSLLDEQKRKESMVIDKSKYPGGKITIYYGSQTGTSESFAQQLEREGVSKGFFVNVVDLEDVITDDDDDHDDEQDENNNNNNNIIVRKLKDAVSSSEAPEEESSSRAIFLVATYGEGEPTDNAMLFVQQLKLLSGISEDDTFNYMKEYIETPKEDDEEEKKSEAIDMIISSDNNTNNNSNGIIDYCVFGLGNKQYEHYNAMGKLFDYTLYKIGCNRILPVGLGDDDLDLENDFELWKEEKLWPTLIEKYIPKGIDVTAVKTTQALPDCPYVVKYHNDDNNKVEEINKNPFIAGSHNDHHKLDKIHASSRHYFTSYDCPIKVIKELRNNPTGDDDDIGSTLHIEIDISNHKDLSYVTADNVGILPKNDPSVVNDVAQSLGYDLNTIFSLDYAENHVNHGMVFPSQITIKECLTRYCDLTICPRRSDLKLLSNYANDELDKTALLRMSSKEGKAEYKEKIVEQMLGFVDILKLCPSISIPLEHLFFVVPRLHPRYYTISSSSSLHPDTIHITIAITKIHLPNNNKRKLVFNGVCSSYLSNETKVGDSIRIFVRESSFRLPTDLSTPILMIGPGTGIAPMRALIQERIDYLVEKKKKKNQDNVGSNILYFGCKYHNQDYIYQDELQNYVTKYSNDNNNNDKLFQLHVAFSRSDPSKKVYVQHLLKEHSKEIWNLIHNKKAYIYVCGGVKMGSDVTETLVNICSTEHDGGNDDKNENNFDAKSYMTHLSNEHRYVQELWA